MKVLALSSSRAGHSGYLETCIPYIQNLLGDSPLRLAFIPFAATGDYEEYCQKVKTALSWLPYKVELVSEKNAKTILDNCDAIVVGGGNTFKLLHDLYEFELLDLIRRKLRDGTPYIGWSAGSNILGISIGTTNDMPIIQPKSFEALGIFPFHINPHYYNVSIDDYNGETRDMRIEEFLSLNQDETVIAIPEGSAIQMEGTKITYHGVMEGYRFSVFQEKVNKVLLTEGLDV